MPSACPSEVETAPANRQNYFVRQSRARREGSPTNELIQTFFYITTGYPAVQVYVAMPAVAGKTEWLPPTAWLAALLLLGGTIFLFIRYVYRVIQTRNWYEQLSELSGEYLFRYDLAADLLILPKASAEFLGLARVNKRFSSRLVPPTRQADEVLLYEVAFSAVEGVRELYCRLPDGRCRWLRVTTALICKKERPIWLIGKILDIQRERETQERLLQKAQRDSLTNLYNAAVSRQLVTAMLGDPEKVPSGALIIFDIDYFKEVNDRMGHPAGDRMLIRVARTLQATFRYNDIIGRMGGDEFLVFMREVRSRDIVEEKCRILQTRLAEIPPEEDGTISMSIGVAMVKGQEDYDELYRRADQALYAVKNNGRNGLKIS